MIGRFKLLLSGLLVIAALILAVIATPITSVSADTYNCGAYGAGAYQNNVCGATTDSGEGAGAGGGGSGLVDTGQSIWLILLAVLLILAGTIMLYRTRKKMKARLTQQPPQVTSRQ